MCQITGGQKFPRLSKAVHRAYKVKLEVEDWQSPWWLVSNRFENTFNLCLQIGLNTNLLYHSDHLSEGKEDPGNQLAFLLEALLMVPPVTLL